MARTVMQVLDATVQKHGERPALAARLEREWKTISWASYRSLAHRVARGFMHLGLAPGKGVAIMGYNRPEWFLADLGAIVAGGVPAGIYTTSTAEQVRYITSHCEAAVAVVETPEQLEKLQSVREGLPDLEAVVLMEGPAEGEGVLSWDQLLDRADEVDEGSLRERIDAQDPGDLCTLIYTSGTTGPPKAVALSHHNLTWTAGAVAEAFTIGPEDQVLSYLPLSHIAEQIVSFHGPMAAGASSWFAESLDKLGENLREVRPHIFFAVPRVWEKIQAAVQAAGAAAPPLRRRIAAWARGLGLEGGRAKQEGRSLPLLYPLADRLVFQTVRRKLGLDRARICVSSAAPLALSTQAFFLSLDIPILEVYGMSECTGPATFSYPDRFRLGKAGLPMPGTEIRIAADGEILIRGPHVFLGYYKDPEATAETLDDEGWIHSGDVGMLDEDGFLQVTDRKKELLITSGGKNVAPQMLEAKLKAMDGVGQAVAVGDGRKYVAALLVLDEDRLPALAERLGSSASDLQDAASCPRIREHLEAQVAAVNETLASYETIKRFAVLPRELTVEAGELTPTMKLKRRVILDHYATEIEELYAD